MKSPFLYYLVLPALFAALPAQADFHYGSEPLFLNKGAQPNVALLLDDSGSMNSQDAGYGPITNNCSTSGTFGSATVELSRFQALRTAACKVVQGNASAMRISAFGYSSSNINSVTDWGASISMLKSSINGWSSTSVGTPMVRSLYAVSRAYRGQLTFSTPIQYRCQKNYAVFFTDGEPNDTQDQISTPSFAIAADMALDSAWPGSAGLYNWDNYPDPNYSGNSFYSSKDFYPWLDDVAQFMYDTDFMKVGSAPTRICPGGSVLANSTNSMDCAGKSWDDPDVSRQNMVTYMVGFGNETNIEMMRDTPLVNQVSVDGTMADVVANTLTIPAHGLETDDYVHYYADKINQSFTTAATANTGTDTLSGNTTDLATGDALTYNNEGTTTLKYQTLTTAAVPAANCGAIGGLTSGSTYYVARRTMDTYRLAVSSAASYSCAAAADANANVGIYCINLTSRGTALTDHAFARTNASVGFYSTNSGTSPVDQTQEMFAITNHGLADNEQVTYHSTTPIGGLTNGTAYYVVYMSTNTFKLATSLANAATCAADVTAPYSSCVLLTSLGNSNAAHEFRKTATAATSSLTATNAGTTPVDVTANMEKVTDTAHGLNTGDRVTYTCTNYPGTPAVYTSYNIPTKTYAIVTSTGNPGTFKLASSAANAASGTAMDISDAGNVNQTFTWNKAVAQPTIPGLQAYVTDLPPDSSPNPATENPARGKYWVEKIDNDTVKLYECAQYCQSRDAAALVDITETTGSGILSTGPGRFERASNTVELMEKMEDVFNDIRLQSSGRASAWITSARILNNTLSYSTWFNSIDWSGEVQANPVHSETGMLVEPPIWKAGEQLPVHSVRNIVTRSDTYGARAFTITNWSSLTANQQTALNNGGGSVIGQDVLNWIRGQEISGYRMRSHGLLGDVLGSMPAYIGAPDKNYENTLPVSAEQSSYAAFKASQATRTPMIYAGANDGMLHGFNADTGAELLAFIPEAVYMDWNDLDDDGVKDAGEAAINKFYQLSRVNYGQSGAQLHHYFVDGSPAVSDAYFGGSWHTVLVGGLGRGGRSVYALEVTDPAAFNPSNVLWEFDDNNSGDMGYSYSEPAIARLSTGQWVAIFGNGYDSRGDQARLYIVNIQTGFLIREISLGVAGGNGLSSIAIRNDATDTAIAVYAGDLQGNIWKIDISNGASLPTSVAIPFFVAQDNSGNRHAITSGITLGENPEGGVMLYVGTGAYFREEDRTYSYPAFGPQYDAMYGLWDNDTGSISVNNLVQQTIGSAVITMVNGAHRTLRTATANPVDYSGGNPDRGWYIKLAEATYYQGEKIIKRTLINDDLLQIYTTLPVSVEDPCYEGVSAMTMVVDGLSGAQLPEPVFDTNLDGVIDGSDISAIGYVMSDTYDDDGIPGDRDNCPNTDNPDQLNADSDSRGDVCDDFPQNPVATADSDGDGMPNAWDAFCNLVCQQNSGLMIDNCPFVVNLNQVNADGDSYGNACDDDDDNDGVLDMADYFPFDPLRSVASTNIIFNFEGDDSDDSFGQSFDMVEDINNDGYADLIVGEYGSDNNGSDSGSALVLNGINGAILYTFNGDSAGDHFGSSVRGAGDVNNDGYADIIVGAWRDDNNGTDSGSARVFSGVNGSILYTFNGDSPGDFFGRFVSSAGDVNGDGYSDLIAGADGDDNNGSESGSARVFSGVNGSILYTFTGDSPGDYLGRSVSGAGDVNNDGYDDVILGAHPSDFKGIDFGLVRVMSGIDGSFLYAFGGEKTYHYLGSHVSGGGDINNDGYADFVVNGLNSPMVRVYSGKGFLSDSDSDGVKDATDSDDDNDSVLDVNDDYPLIRAVSSNSDSDNFPSGWNTNCNSTCQINSGLILDNCLNTANQDQLNTDGDTLGNVCDSDDDNDGVSDASDKFPLAVAVSVDTDNDGYANSWNAACDVTCQSASGLSLDNGPTISNITQANFDGDSQGDVCDSDDDNDGVPDSTDAFDFNPAESVDTDNDGIGNNADTDDDNDSIEDVSDNCPLGVNADQLNTDGDTQGNSCDTDDDNDGLLDTEEATKGTNPLLADTDGDGINDLMDAFPLDATESVDTDSDTTGNNADWDDDNDGVPDTVDTAPLDASDTTEIILPLDSTYKGSELKADQISQ